ncbi:uncharacterized protein CTRU02_206561 [Colletotrichum truncatum]|uniref:Uncharacterized protein n=1 Tax=Colletotrichum truncatum TaxID=5467 RepID=A0ACC3Z7A6_COLTU|nr:uncharacterized protein CTRU02_11930 [Colletotrichum truncatum]KAF6785305.1 hypothetical protein CTRU02_11930 [Colletotrichum truncatum]
MGTPNMPNWLRIFLLILGCASFIPQLHRFWIRRDTSGISLYYVLANLLVATEIFTISFFLVINQRVEGSDFFVHHPPDAGDAINLVHFAFIWFLWLAIFVFCLVYPSDQTSPRSKSAVTIFVSFLLISIVPLIADATVNDIRERDRRLLLAIFGYIHASFINLVITIFGIMGMYIQIREVYKQPPGSGLGALSLQGLAIQSVVFALLGISWIWRLVFPWEHLDWPEELSLAQLWALAMAWFQYAGFPTVDYLVFALGQAFILFLALRRRVTNVSPNETEPLLGSDA